ncbi:hypothetical protein ONS95_001284 [Cadophora gregata]|uniref:uncharacterized protein n=1 Tax=Cadophora gregata TaxID=51156 RepID=UPI0026DCD9B5|nr:uncharacterized protein ONS95_001284 [Cadophora gregata]KAK0101904.1 hypothetical protein ONS96_005878 [Cadophora gregata f. sp. sojae]KAK0129357.1 hypothetical protein ONS95_001284 [Cadophora gregata]
MASPTGYPTISDDATSYLNSNSTRTPSDLAQPRNNKLQALLNQIRDLQIDNTVLKKATVGLKTFTLFPQLPLELRLKIWRSAMHMEEVFALGHLENEQESEFFPQLRLLSAAGKSSLMHVNMEARDEGKKVLSQFVHKGRSTWYNPDTDTAWFPRPDYETLMYVEEELLEKKKLRIYKMAFPYQYSRPWPEHMVETHERYNGLNLRELVFVLGSKDLRKQDGTETINSTNRPADFVLPLGPDVTTTNLCWEDLAGIEMRNMEYWKKETEDARDKLKREGWTQEDFDYHSSRVPCANPKITFRFTRDDLSLMDDDIFQCRS